jgi:uncharacterized protein YyaL (SSP411 family)
VLAAGARVSAALAGAGLPASSGAPVSAAMLDEAATTLLAQADRRNGGFGGAPKFPPSMALEFLLRHHERAGSSEALEVAAQCLEAMARGGIYDQLAGGFARYSVDASWVVPHLEKMLYDNALLLRAYLHWWRLTGSPLALRIARETAEFLLRDLRTAQGGFASSLDADTDGVEGLTYVWTPAQLHEAVGERAQRAAELFGVTDQGTFEGGASTLQLPQDPADSAEQADYAELRGLLLAARTTRPQPGRDDKVVAAWNGLAIASLAEAAMLLDEPRYLDAASAAAELVHSTHLVDGTLRRTSRDGVAGDAAAVAEDYGDLADGLLALHQASADPDWLTRAGELLDIALIHFADTDGGGAFFDTGDDAEQLLRRPRDPTDNAAPSGNSALAGALVGYSALTGSLSHRAAAETVLASVGSFAVGKPRFFGWALAAAEGVASGPVQVAVVGEPDGGPLTSTAWRCRPPGAVVVGGTPDAPGVPLLAQRPLLDGAAAAYVCRGMVCDRPVTTADELRAALGS